MSDSMEDETKRPATTVYCQGSFATTYGKTAHGLVRRSRRYQIRTLIDAAHAGADAGLVLDGEACGIPVVATLVEAAEEARAAGRPLEQLVFGIAPDGGKLPTSARATLLEAMALGLDVDCGLHDFLTDDPELVAAADRAGVVLRDIRKPPPRSKLHFFSGKIEQVDCLKVAVLGTDSAVGKRTTAWLLVDQLAAVGRRCELIGTGQTAWLQGARYSIVLDSLVNDFVSGEIEHAVWSAWKEQNPDVLVLEGQGSLMNPAYPGGFELLAAGRPDVVVLQHAPARLEYDGFPGYPIQSIERQIEAIELLSGRPVVAITINSEGLDAAGLERERAKLTAATGLPAWEPLRDGVDELAKLIEERVRSGPESDPGSR